MKYVYLLSICLFLSFNGWGQRLDTFPQNPNQFLNVFSTFMTESGNKAIKEIFEPFQSVFSSGGYSDEERNTIIETTNRMLEKRMTSNPYFKLYIEGLNLVKVNDNEGQIFKDWHIILNGFLQDEERSSQEYKNYLDFTVDFFETGALRSSSGGITWKAKNTDYQFTYREGNPYLEWKETDLVGFRKNDTMRIKNTAGVFDPENRTWVGKKGRVDWDSTGLEGEIYVEFDTYKLDLNKSFYEVDSVLFYYPNFFPNGPVKGFFTDKIINQSSAGKVSFPRFESRDGAKEIKNFGEGIDYRGGFSLYGGTIYGSATEDEKAKINVFNKNQEKAFSASADRFTVKQGTELSGQQIDAVFYYGEDSLSHPSVNIRYDMQARRLELNRGKSGSDRNPFFSSSHNINIHTDYIIADLTGDSIMIGKKSARILRKDPVNFQSLNYFNKSEYEQLQGLSSVNPLVVLMRVYKNNMENPFIPANRIAAAYGSNMTEKNLAGFLYNLSAKGFINYDEDRGVVEIKEKVKHYAEANFGQRDFDRIKILSDTLDVNAYLNVSEKTIQVRGVKQLELSPLRRVGVLPDSNSLILKPGMNLDFRGNLFAGFTELKGKDFHFDYKDFKVRMDSIDHLRFFPPTKDPKEFKNPPAFALNSEIENANGILLIDAPSNKSGQEDIPIFPSFTTKNSSYIYYDNRKVVKDTVYGRDSFYFELEPFTLNSLNAYMKEDLNFKGKLVSGGIFPDFKETIGVREDFSFGFIHKTPEEGYLAYGKQGTYTGEIDLSNKGLLGVGQLDYLGASIVSEDFVFRPESTTGSANSFDLPEVREGEVTTPQVHADAVNINWLPYKDSLYIRSEKFEMFQDDQYSLKGLLTLTPSGVKGNGTLEWPQASVDSKIFSFGPNSVEADTMNVNIKSMQAQDAIALSTENFKGKIDFDEKIGQFESNDTSYVNLKHNQYISTMNAFKWDLSNEDLSLERDDKGLGKFISVVQGQDSLQFLGRNASIDLKNNELLVQEVPQINSADAVIYPDSNRVRIRPGGSIATLTNAIIVADSVKKTHKIVRAEVDILGRKSYKAKGFYEYNIAGKEQEIEFSGIVGERIGKGKISLRPTATRASGTVEATDSFLIDARTSFYGDISLASESVNLKFQGFARLNADKLPRQTWFGVNCEADKNNLVIPYKYPRDEEGYQAFTGFYLNKSVPFIYPSVMTPPNTLQDRKILDVVGVFKYDKSTDRFIFGDSSKVLLNAARGNQLIFDNKNGKVTGEGKLGIASELKYTNLDIVGTAASAFIEVPDSLKAQTPPPALEVEATSGIKFTLPERLYRFILAESERNQLSMTPIPYLADQDKYKKHLSMLFPEGKELTEAFNGMALGKVEIPNKINDYTFLVTDLKMKWDMDYQAFVSKESQVGLISINGTPLNKRIEAYIQYSMPSVGGDRFYYYFKFPSQIFYYFGFKQGVLEIYSNDSQFMDAASKMKKSELVIKQPGGDTYEILIETAARANMFVRRVKASK